jgi:hypothetical protein
LPCRSGGTKQRALLALLALHRGEPVSADRLIDVLWGDGQAANPANALQAQIGSCGVFSGQRRSSSPKLVMPSPSVPGTSMKAAWSDRPVDGEFGCDYDDDSAAAAGCAGSSGAPSYSWLHVKQRSRPGARCHCM